jgi:hypothetical protein
MNLYGLQTLRGQSLIVKFLNVVKSVLSILKKSNVDMRKVLEF